MPVYEVEVTQTYRGRVWAANEEELRGNVEASVLTFDSEELTDWSEMEENN